MPIFKKSSIIKDVSKLKYNKAENYMENNINKSFEFTGKEIAEIEWVLVKAIELFHESPYPYTIKNDVQEYFLRYFFFIFNDHS